MEVLRNITELQSFKRLLNPEKQLGFVPTMGALHSGHASLIKTALSECSCVIASIFVNPTQFNQSEDFEKYPRTESRDLKLLEELGCHAVFIPSVEDMYPEPFLFQASFESLSDVMEGRYRPGHFNGVAIVVSKFFNLIQPNRAYFGKKDLQQLVVIKNLVSALSFPVKITACETLREASGLAMSSRNERLSEAGRKKASVIYEALKSYKESLLKGEDFKVAQHDAVSKIEAAGLRPEYMNLAKIDDLSSIEKREELSSSTVAICVAAHLEGVRLIDNIVFSL